MFCALEFYSIKIPMFVMYIFVLVRVYAYTADDLKTGGGL